MSKILAVAWQEFSQTVFRKVFLLGVLGIPILAVGGFALLLVIMSTLEQPPLAGTVAIVHPSEDVADAARQAFSEEKLAADREEQLKKATDQAREQVEGGGFGPGVPGAGAQNIPLARGEIRIDIEHIPRSSDADLEDIRNRVQKGGLLAAAVVPEQLLTPPDPESDNQSTFTLFVAPELDSDHALLLNRRFGEAIVNVRAQRANVDPDQMHALLRKPQSKTQRVLRTGGTASEGEGARLARVMIPMAFMMLLWASVFTAGQHLMMATIEEKSNRVMEVLLSAASPLQLMTGKILGHGGVGLLIISIYGSLGVGILLALSLFTQFISVLDLVYLLVFFFMAYFMIATMFAAVGSAVSDIREANTLITPVMMLVMLPLILWLPISEAPNGMIAQIFSFIPPAIPFVMILRVTADEPIAMWQILTSIAWGYACVLAMVWLAAKIFRVGVLMYGKPPSPLELIKWVRFS